MTLFRRRKLDAYFVIIVRTFTLISSLSVDEMIRFHPLSSLSSLVSLQKLISNTKLRTTIVSEPTEKVEDDEDNMSDNNDEDEVCFTAHLNIYVLTYPFVHHPSLP